MNKSIENINTYLSNMKIKQTFISLKTGIEPSKLSRILNGNQDPTITDMDKISNSLGHKVDFFLSDNFIITNEKNYMANNNAEFVFYAGEPTHEQELFAMQLIDLIENVDEILGASNRFMTAIME